MDANELIRLSSGLLRTANRIYDLKMDDGAGPSNTRRTASGDLDTLGIQNEYFRMERDGSSYMELKEFLKDQIPTVVAYLKDAGFHPDAYSTPQVLKFFARGFRDGYKLGGFGTTSESRNRYVNCEQLMVLQRHSVLSVGLSRLGATRRYETLRGAAVRLLEMLCVRPSYVRSYADNRMGENFSYRFGINDRMSLMPPPGLFPDSLLYQVGDQGEASIVPTTGLRGDSGVEAWFLPEEEPLMPLPPGEEFSATLDRIRLSYSVQTTPTAAPF